MKTTSFPINQYPNTTRIISDDHVKHICKIGQRNLTCRFLIGTTNGCECAKNTPVGEILNQRVAENTIIAQGDNCDGIHINTLVN